LRSSVLLHPLTGITTETIDGLVETIQGQGNSNGTINRKLAALSRMLTIAQQRGKLDRLPHIQRKVESECRIRFLSQEEETTALHVLIQWGKDDHADALVLLIDTGLRPSELWQVEARDFDHQVINIWKTKNRNARSISMTRRVGDILLRRAQRFPRGPLFPFDNYWMEHTWDRMKAHMGLSADTQFLPYTLRHTCISRLVQRGVPLKVVQEWAGHRNITTTMRYAHLCPTSLLDAVKVLNGSEQGQIYASSITTATASS
jgi:integrase